MNAVEYLDRITDVCTEIDTALEKLHGVSGWINEGDVEVLEAHIARLNEVRHELDQMAGFHAEVSSQPTWTGHNSQE